MQDTEAGDDASLDPRTMDAYESINLAADGLLLHCKHAIGKPYVAIFGMLMAASRIAVAASLDVRMLHQALDAMYEDALKAERGVRGEH